MKGNILSTHSLVRSLKSIVNREIEIGFSIALCAFHFILYHLIYIPSVQQKTHKATQRKRKNTHSNTESLAFTIRNGARNCMGEEAVAVAKKNKQIVNNSVCVGEGVRNPVAFRLKSSETLHTQFHLRSFATAAAAR